MRSKIDVNPSVLAHEMKGVTTSSGFKLPKVDHDVYATQIADKDP